MVNANGKTWVKSKWMNVKREVTIDNKVPEQVGEDGVWKHRRRDGLWVGEGMPPLLYQSSPNSSEDSEEPRI